MKSFIDHLLESVETPTTLAEDHGHVWSFDDFTFNENMEVESINVTDRNLGHLVECGILVLSQDGIEFESLDEALEFTGIPSLNEAYISDKSIQFTHPETGKKHSFQVSSGNVKLGDVALTKKATKKQGSIAMYGTGDAIILNMSSATDCRSALLGTCSLAKENNGVAEWCYARSSEKMRSSNLTAKRLQEVQWRSLAKQHPGLIALGISNIIGKIRKSGNPLLRFVRLNESGEFSDNTYEEQMSDAIKARVREVSGNVFHDDISVLEQVLEVMQSGSFEFDGKTYKLDKCHSTIHFYTYTHRYDIINKFKNLMSMKNFTLNGSGFMMSNNFVPVDYEIFREIYEHKAKATEAGTELSLEQVRNSLLGKLDELEIDATNARAKSSIEMLRKSVLDHLGHTDKDQDGSIINALGQKEKIDNILFCQQSCHACSYCKKSQGAHIYIPIHGSGSDFEIANGKIAVEIKAKVDAVFSTLIEIFEKTSVKFKQGIVPKALTKISSKTNDETLKSIESKASQYDILMYRSVKELMDRFDPEVTKLWSMLTPIEADRVNIIIDMFSKNSTKAKFIHELDCLLDVILYVQAHKGEEGSVEKLPNIKQNPENYFRALTQTARFFVNDAKTMIADLSDEIKAKLGDADTLANKMDNVRANFERNPNEGSKKIYATPLKTIAGSVEKALEGEKKMPRSVNKGGIDKLNSARPDGTDKDDEKLDESFVGKLDRLL